MYNTIDRVRNVRAFLFVYLQGLFGLLLWCAVREERHSITYGPTCCSSTGTWEVETLPLMSPYAAAAGCWQGRSAINHCVVTEHLVAVCCCMDWCCIGLVAAAAG
jgi:hypothetical protein